MTKAELISEIAIQTGFDKKTIGVCLEAFTEGNKEKNSPNMANLKREVVD